MEENLAVATPAPILSPLRRSMRSTIWEGLTFVLGNSFTGGVFLAGFAAAVGADARLMGIIASLPFLASFFQVPGAHLAEYMRRRKPLFLISNLLNGAAWATLGGLAIFAFSTSTLGWILFVAAALGALCLSTRSLTWLDWMRALVPGTLRARFFAHRNRQTLVASILLSLPAARLIDMTAKSNPEGAIFAYGLVFLVGGGLMMLSQHFTQGIVEPEYPPLDKEGIWKSAIKTAWNDKPFRRYFFYRLFASFSMATTGPLLTFYLLDVLKYSTTAAAALDVMAVIISAATLLPWAKLSDSVGNRPALFLTFSIKVVWCGLWFFLTPNSWLLVIIIYILSAHGSGNTLLHQSLMLKLVPEKGSAISLSLFNSITSGFAFLAPMLAGFLVHSLPRESAVFGHTITNWQWLILVSTIFRSGAVVGLIWVQEPKSMQLGQFVRLVFRGFSSEEPVTVGLPTAAEPPEDEPRPWLSVLTGKIRGGLLRIQRQEPPK